VCLLDLCMRVCFQPANFGRRHCWQKVRIITSSALRFKSQAVSAASRRNGCVTPGTSPTHVMASCLSLAVLNAGHTSCCHFCLCFWLAFVCRVACAQAWCIHATALWLGSWDRTCASPCASKVWCFTCMVCQSMTNGYYLGTSHDQRLR
jgi:hypothetical protein